MDVHTPAQRARNMKAIKASGTRIEIALGKALWARGIRYRKNDSTVFGRPDFTIKRNKVAIFVDSEFWHGKDWNKAKFRIKTNRKFWWNKIEANIRRDRLVTKTLRDDGWTVIRFWGSQIVESPERCILKVETGLKNRRDG